MSCEQGPNRFSRLAGRVSGGIAQLAGKRGFYAGLALGCAGLIGAGLVAAARRRSRSRLKTEVAPLARPVPALVNPRQVPQLGQREKARPLAAVGPGERCAGCRTPAGTKPGAWYNVNGHPYCPDCAPEAAGRAGVDLVAPAAPGGSLTAAGGQPAAAVAAAARNPVMTSASLSQPQYLPAERRVPTSLAPSRIGVYAGQDEQDRPVWYAVNRGYVVVRADGSDTGLALTPGLKVSGSAGEVEEDLNRWWITHIASGKHLPEAGPYERPEEGQLLAGVLAQLDWTRPETELTTGEIRRVGATITAYNTALAEAKKQAGTPGAAPPHADPTHRQPPAGGSLEGKLVADGYGGVARVLDATRSGDRLFVVDSLGERYEVAADQVRPPDEADFEGVRVAMSVDPAGQPETRCAMCGRAAKNAGAGERWYRMNWKTFCDSCSTRYAAQEAYLKEDEIGDMVGPGR